MATDRARKIVVARAARSDWGHVRGICVALGDQATIVDVTTNMKYIVEWLVGADAIIILGDRWEMAIVSIAAVYARVPIVHLHGGEHTPNVIDNRYRHAISQMASVHCVAHEVHRQRLLRMGIEDATIHVTGAPGLDRYGGPILSRDEVAHRLGLDPLRAWAMILLHPTTYRPQDADEEWEQMLDALDDHQPIFFTPGNDPGSELLTRRMEQIIKQCPGARLVEFVEESIWIALLRSADIVIGNTSAIVIDCPFLGKRTIEIGRRQEGRERVPYGDGQSVPRVLEVLRAMSLEAIK